VYTYRDGVFWWAKIEEPRVISATKRNFALTNPMPSETVLVSTIPYTIAIHWRQAHKYLQQVEASINTTR
ncbi:MAG: hypothetical protein ABR607_17070, partial [Pyrinomonadaceae bacterium]